VPRERALRDAAKSWPLLLAAFLCSAGVASLWGANIAALFPIIEVTLNGDSLQEWNARRINDARKRIEINVQQEAAINGQIASGLLSADETTSARNTLDTVAMSKRGDEALLYSSEKLDPWLHRFLPDDLSSRRDFPAWCKNPKHTTDAHLLALARECKGARREPLCEGRVLVVWERRGDPRIVDDDEVPPARP
jgi:hypothetical protein